MRVTTVQIISKKLRAVSYEDRHIETVRLSEEDKSNHLQPQEVALKPIFISILQFNSTDISWAFDSSSFSFLLLCP